MTTTLTFNQFKSTAIYGTFSNVDSSNGSILADGKFKRNLTIEGNLILGKQTILDANGNPVNSESTIQFTLDNVLYNIPLRTLSFIKNVTSDVQQQLTNISNGSSFSNITVSGLINGIKINNYGNENTSFSSGNTDIFGNNNTRFGYFTGSLLGYSNAVFGDQSLQNCTGNSNTAIGHNSQNGNTNYNYNTSVGSNSNIIGGSSNIAIGHVAQCSNCSNSIVIGNSITSTTNNEILLGSSVHTTQIPGNINFSGKITQNIGNQNTAIGLLSFTSNTSGGYNTVYGYNSMTSNTGGAYCTSVGCNSLQTSNAFGNTAIGYNAGINVGTGTYNTFLGHNTTVNQVVSNSTAIGSNAICNASNQIMLGTSTENVVIPGNLTFNQSINNISTTIFGYLSGLTSNIQSQINNNNSNITTLQNKTTDILWTPGQINKTTISNQCETTTLSFSNTLNNISTTTFSYLSGLTSNIQDQINALNNSTPAGMIIAYAGTSTTLTGYKLCDGSIYNAQYAGSAFVNLFNAIGYTYGGDPVNGNFRVPNYKGLFLRCKGSQNVQGKWYTASDFGTTVNDQSTYFSTSNYVNNITTNNKTVVTGISPNIGTLSTTSVVGSLNVSTSNNSYNDGNNETFPAHMSVQYFIKY